MTAAPFIAGAVIAALVYIKWALTPVVIAFKVGRLYERVRAERRRAR